MKKLRSLLLITAALCCLGGAVAWATGIVGNTISVPAPTNGGVAIPVDTNGNTIPNMPVVPFMPFGPGIPPPFLLWNDPSYPEIFDFGHTGGEIYYTDTSVPLLPVKLDFFIDENGTLWALKTIGNSNPPETQLYRVMRNDPPPPPK